MLEEIRPHLVELRQRLIKSVVALLILFFAAFSVWEPIMAWVVAPLKEAMAQNSQVVAIGVGEQFFSAILVSFFAALVVGIPFIFYQIWAFVSPGLYEHEKKLVIPFVASASIMFALGAAFAYYIVFPMGFAFLVNFGGSTIQAMISIKEYIDFFVKLMIAFGLSFELPVVIFLLAKLGLVDDRQLMEFFRYAVIIIFIIAAILTPPDVLSQVLMAIPLIILYGISIVVARIVNPAPPYKEEDNNG
ncbi:MAG: twin-arginine translocase subunit TatC [Campylobacterales bacterium]